jgi:hypothetical protein
VAFQRAARFHAARGPSGIGRVPSALLLLALLLPPTPALAQFGALEALAGNVTDLSFFGGYGGLLPVDEKMGADSRTFSFGVELLFQIASVERPSERDRATMPTDSVRLTWSRMEVVHTGEGVDTIYFYDVDEVRPPPPPTDTVWTIEMGIGYGQTSGFELADGSLQFRGSVRDLPSATVYASYEPWSTYFGFRTGFMRTKSLQALERETGSGISGEAEAFLAGVLAGYAWSIGDFWAVIEAAYTIRYFPGVEWATGSLPAGVPSDLQLSGWTLSTGLQFPIR